MRIMDAVYHIPAMLKETIDGLAIKPGGVYVDVTFGGGGHSRAILENLGMENGRLFSFDQDSDALQNAIDDERWTFVHSNFRYLQNWMEYYGVTQIDGLLADLGVSFHHFDCPERGFSFRFSAPLDMRMNRTSKMTAAAVVNSYNEAELTRILRLYGEMGNYKQVIRYIHRARVNHPIERTEDLVRTIASDAQVLENGEIEVAPKYKKDLAKLFQALRIEVNDELGALREMLVTAKNLLKPGGRMAVLTYHSLEDRLVKNFFKSGNLEGTIEKDFYGNVVSPFRVIEKGRMADEEEVARNPRSRSAKLRVAEKIEN